MASWIQGIPMDYYPINPYPFLPFFQWAEGTNSLDPVLIIVIINSMIYSEFVPWMKKCLYLSVVVSTVI